MKKLSFLIPLMPLLSITATLHAKSPFSENTLKAIAEAADKRKLISLKEAKLVAPVGAQ